MKRMIEIELPDGLKSTAVARSEELIIHSLVANNAVVMSAVMMRPFHIGPNDITESGTGYRPDESTRQDRR